MVKTFINDIKLCMLSKMDVLVASKSGTTTESGSSQGTVSDQVFGDVLRLDRHDQVRCQPPIACGRVKGPRDESGYRISL